MSKPTEQPAELAKMQAELAKVRRQKTEAEHSYHNLRARLRGGTAVSPIDVNRISAERNRLVEIERDLVGRIDRLGDPRKLIENLDDSVPFVLFPLRVETRFMQTGSQHELWIRVYPDDCQVQTYTDFITSSELASTRRFWSDYWKSGRVPAQERAAWKGLVASHGSGRAAVLVRRYKPAGSPPTKSKPEDIFLVVLPELVLNPQQREHAAAFWIAFWRAGKSVTARDEARRKLVAAVGATLADKIISSFRPVNLADEPSAPATHASVTVNLVTLELPPSAGVDTVESSWQQAPRAVTLPDRFVFRGEKGDQVVFELLGSPIPSTLEVGPDPSLPKAEQIKSVNGDLVLNQELRWLTDFQQAIACGMGIKVPLSAAAYQAGLDRLIVLGVRLSTDADHGAELLETLLRDHHASKSGLSLLLQGTPTNNTEDLPSGYSWLDDADTSYDRVFGTVKDFPLESDPLHKRDGQWLAELLGIDVAVLRQVAHADGLDQAHARAMNTALWPTTWGYFLSSMVGPQIDDETIERVRTFFIRYISGRGAAPALRIGKQPYGVLPATVHSRLNLDPDTLQLDAVPRPINVPVPTPEPAPGPIRPDMPTGPVIARTPVFDPWPMSFLNGLQARLTEIFKRFDPLKDHVSHVGKPNVSDPQQLLLDILSLHPSSVEYYQRYLQSLEQHHNEAVMEYGVALANAMEMAFEMARSELLSAVGLDDDLDLPLLEKVLDNDAELLTGPVIDDVPLSEEKPIRPYTADGKNYLAWLADSLYDRIYREDFGNKARPKALLYLLARHALLMSYWDASVRLLSDEKLLDPKQARQEANFLHLSDKVDGRSKFEVLARKESRITGDTHSSLAEYLDLRPVLATKPAAARLQQVKQALSSLRDASTASLERLFAEHIDLCHYRLDAWRLGLVHHRLAQQRARKARGAYLGAFGWLENLKPENKVLTPATIPTKVNGTFVRPGRPTVMRDSKNGGYIHAPSLGQATAAAVLRNGYLTHATPQQPGPMAVNLSSARVRNALNLIEGIQRGQGLAALLGYQFERGLHDAQEFTGVEAERFLFKLRNKFPLVANKHKETREVTSTTPEASADKLQARNVIDGLALLTHIRKTGQHNYPFGFSLGDGANDLPTASADEAKAINALVVRLEDANDAVADLMIAESVYQVTQGKSERAAAAADTIGKGGRPPEPEVVRTPRSGIGLTHRVALHLDSTAVAPAEATPRATAEPALEAWLRSRFPPPEQVACSVSFSVPGQGETSLEVTQAELGLGTLDMLYLVPLDGQQQLGTLDDRIEHHVRSTAARHPAAALTIHYTRKVPGKISFFELGALARHLRPLVFGSRPLSATDAVRPVDAAGDDSRWDVEQLAKRIEATSGRLHDFIVPLVNLASEVGSSPEEYLDKAAPLLLGLALHGVPETGLAALRSPLSDLYQRVARKLTAVITRWEAALAEADALLASLPGLASDTVRMETLARVEHVLASTETSPRPDTLAAYQAIVQARKLTFQSALDGLRAPLNIPLTRLDAFFDAVEPALAVIGSHDPVWFDVERKANDLAPERAALAELRNQIAARISALHQGVQKRTTAAAALVGQARATSETRAGVKLLEEGARQILGDAARVLPRFTLAASTGAELTSAFAARAGLLTDLLAGGRDFPVDDWLYGVARVREPLARWEKAVLLAEGMGCAAPELTPLQLPFQANDRWAALELAASVELDGEKLLYTAHFAHPFDDTRAQCGLVLDEWTEVVPGKQEVTGLAFHFDQPNTEPPQAILLNPVYAENRNFSSSGSRRVFGRSRLCTAEGSSLSRHCSPSIRSVSCWKST